MDQIPEGDIENEIMVFGANRPETSTRVEFLGWEVLFLWLFTCYQWRVNTNSLKYVMKKKCILH